MEYPSCPEEIEKRQAAYYHRSGVSWIYTAGHSGTMRLFSGYCGKQACTYRRRFALSSGLYGQGFRWCRCGNYSFSQIMVMEGMWLGKFVASNLIESIHLNFLLNMWWSWSTAGKVVDYYRKKSLLHVYTSLGQLNFIQCNGHITMLTYEMYKIYYIVKG